VLVTLPGSPPEVGPLAAEVAAGTVRRIVFAGRPVGPTISGAHDLSNRSTAADAGSVDLAGDLDRDRDIAAQLRAQVEAYFAGDLRTFSVPVDLAAASGFAQRVYRELVEVGFGETVTYGQLASMAGRPGAARAVGSAMAGNPWPLVVPCHRVVPVSGAPGGYAGGPAAKVFLLALEAQVAP
jgi:methylated-DNA-[protein]-cysteine S-methyltransferase